MRSRFSILFALLFYALFISSATATGFPTLYASFLFGLLSIAATLAVAVPAAIVTWITVLVLLTFAGKPRRSLVREGWKITADITGVAINGVLKEGNLVAALCAVLSIIVLFQRR